VYIGVAPVSVSSAPRSIERDVIVPANGAVTFEKLWRSPSRRTFASCAATFDSAAASVASSVSACAWVCSSVEPEISFWSARFWLRDAFDFE